MNYTFRMHDPRIGRFFAVDPLTSSYPFYSPYQFSGNRLIDMVELEGLEPYPANPEDENIEGQSVTTSEPLNSEWGEIGKSSQEWYWHTGTIVNHDNEQGKYTTGHEKGWYSWEDYLNIVRDGKKTANIGYRDSEISYSDNWQNAYFTVARIDGAGHIDSPYFQGNGIEELPMFWFDVVGIGQGVSALRGMYLARNNVKLWKAMSTEEFNAFTAKGLTYKKRTELFVSTSEKYSRGLMLKHPDKYQVLVEFTMKPNTMSHFKSVGVTHGWLPEASAGWARRGSLLFKPERGGGRILNIGIQSNTHLFNPWMQGYRVIK